MEIINEVIEIYMEDGTWAWYNTDTDDGFYGYDTKEEAVKEALEAYKEPEEEEKEEVEYSWYDYNETLMDDIRHDIERW